MRISVPGKCLWKLFANESAASGTASQTAKDVSVESESCFEKRLKAISDPIRPRPKKLMLLERDADTCRWIACK